MSNPLPNWMDQKIWPQIYGMMLNDAYFKLMWHARKLTGTFNGPIAELIQVGYLTTQTIAIRRLCAVNQGVCSGKDTNYRGSLHEKCEGLIKRYLKGVSIYEGKDTRLSRNIN